MKWAIAEGMASEDADVTGREDLLVDELWPGRRHPLRHFNPFASLLFAPLELRRAIVLDRTGDRVQALVHLGRSLHSRQDAIGHGRFGLGHLRYDIGQMKRHPDFWEQMPPSVQSRIERATRRAVRTFIRDTAPSR
jgi:hypothetical protein